MSKDLTDALREMMQQHDANVVPAPQPRGAAPKAVSAARLPGGSGSSAAGWVSPLTEVAYAARTWHPEKLIVSSDGIFALRVRAVKDVTLTDAAATEVKFDFKGPP